MVLKGPWNISSESLKWIQKALLKKKIPFSKEVKKAELPAQDWVEKVRLQRIVVAIEIPNFLSEDLHWKKDESIERHIGKIKGLTPH